MGSGDPMSTLNGLSGCGRPGQRISAEAGGCPVRWGFVVEFARDIGHS